MFTGHNLAEVWWVCLEDLGSKMSMLPAMNSSVLLE